MKNLLRSIRHLFGHSWEVRIGLHYDSSEWKYKECHCGEIAPYRHRRKII